MFSRQNLQEGSHRGSGSDDTAIRRRINAPTEFLCGITDIGLVRRQNEDTFYIAEDGSVLIVADGMGGHSAGDVASGLATSFLADYMRAVNESRKEPDGSSVESLLCDAFQRAHQHVIEEARSRSDCGDMGTALILAYLESERLTTCHIGDVRCYVQDRSGLRQITEDHSLVGTLVKAGKLTPEEARVHPRRNEILQALGLSTEITPDIRSADLSLGDHVLLCSDGLWEALGDDDIRSILELDRPLKERAMTLVNRANEESGTDNITVVLYEHINRSIPESTDETNEGQSE
ncbi:Stp1/IreP family PP2C-type Ser/Thr phosphatase [Thermodesulfobacteriota bacterium]